METVADLIFLGSKITADSDLQPRNQKKSYYKPRWQVKKHRHHFTNKGTYSQSYGFSSSHVYRRESWIIKKAEPWRIDAFEPWCWWRLLRAPWTAKIKPVNPKGNQPWIFIGRTNAEAEAPILWPPDVKSGLCKRSWCWCWLKKDVQLRVAS